MAPFQRRRRSATSSPLRVSRSKNALTASGVRVDRRVSEAMLRLAQPWQTRAFNYYDLLGEIKYASQFYSRMLAPLRLFAGELVDGEVEETDNPKAVAALERIQDPGGGRTVLLSTYGRLMFLAGECNLFVSEDDNGVEQWEMLSTDELKMQGSTYMRYKAPSLGAEEYREAPDDDSQEAWQPVGQTAVAYRLWQRHPRYSYLADSTMQGVLDLCEELVLLTQAVRARARSRLAGAGALFIDERISPALPEPAPGEDPIEDTFVADLVEAMSAPMADEGAASAVVPLVIRVPVPEGSRAVDMVSHLQLVDPTQLYPETGLRYECIKRIALGLDMPPEHLLGLGESNHWTAWLVDESTWKAHGQPKAQQLCDDLTASYFRPYLRTSQGMGEEANRFVVGYDAAAIINHPDRAKDAKDLYDKRAIGKVALRDATGFSDEDAMTQDELAESVGIAVRDGSLAWYGEPSPRGGTVEPQPGEVVSTTGVTSAPDAGPSTGAEVEAGPPPAAANGGLADVIGAARILGAADLALLRAREAAGNRLKSLAKRDPVSLSRIEGVPPGRIACVLGREGVRALRAPSERDLVAGARDLIAEALRVWGIDDARVQQKVADVVEQHAARTLYEERPRGLPDSFVRYLEVETKTALTAGG